jgi:hypothetical protein
VLRRAFALSFVAIISLVILGSSVGCGSVSNKMPNPTPTPTPMPTATPSPTPTPSAASDSFLSTMFLGNGRTPSPVGPITIDTSANDGSGNLHFTGIGENNTMLVLQFCPYPQAFNGCFNVTSLTTDATGGANVNFMFPQKGAYFKPMGLSLRSRQPHLPEQISGRRCFPQLRLPAAFSRPPATLRAAGRP